ncbi:AntA/AntB antirepressor [uncultured Caudovirales phage]|uniref:AntA/AntB antirepressor n=1 Tax=uncultured Caudovirales phage TaxID=2100421 RepID=A0A6J5RDZ3_9CAUD|nr:AntA/AntB antirepressor [uncultured Caudovirales phage]
MELIKIQSMSIGGEEVNAVSARELHAFLGVGKHFASWFPEQAFRAQLVDGKHFVLLPEVGKQTGRGGRNRLDYMVLMDSAKKIAMMAGTAKGDEVRDYFIECERRAHATVPAVGFDVAAMLANPATMLKLIGGYCQQIVEANECIAVMEPKVQALERITASEGTLCLTDSAKHLGVKRTFLIDYLSTRQWIYRREGTTWLAYDAKRHQGLLETKTTVIKVEGRPDKSVSQTRITPKGLAKLAEIFNSASNN